MKSVNVDVLVIFALFMFGFNFEKTASIDSLLLCCNPNVFWTKHKLYAPAWCFSSREASIQTSL